MIMKTKLVKNTGQIWSEGVIGKLPGGSNCQVGGGAKGAKNCTGGIAPFAQ